MLKALRNVVINAFVGSGTKHQSITDRLPVEILELIFSQACLDGGYTGCSLSCVSRASQQIVRTCRFHSVSLHSDSAEKVAKFVACLIAERTRAAGSPPKVRHLYLTSAKGDPRKIDDGRERFEGDVSALMDLVASDLYTPYVLNEHMDRTILPSTIGYRSFPELRELTVVGRAVGFATDSYVCRRLEPDPMPPLPKLTHLQVMSTDVWDSHDWFLRRWSERSPGITHLRLTHFTWVAERGAEDLRRLTGVQGEPVFQDLELFIVQPCARPPARREVWD